MICERRSGGVDVDSCGGLGGVEFAFFEEMGSGLLIALLPGFIELDLFEELVAEGVAEEAAVFEDLVAGIFFFVVFFFAGLGIEEGGRGDEAVGVVEDGVFDEGFGGDGVDGAGVTMDAAAGCGTGGGGDIDALRGHAGLLRQGAESDLQAVEDEAGAARVDVVAGNGVHDLGDGGADAVALFGVGEVMDAGAAEAGFRVGDRAAGGVVVVAELLGTQAGTAALAAGGEDVAAAAAGGFFLVAGLGFVFWHVGTPSPVIFAQSLRK